MLLGTGKNEAFDQERVNLERRHPVPSVAELYQSYCRYLWRCLRSLGVLEADLDDTIQDLFLIVQRKLTEFDGQVAPKTWLYAIALRLARRRREQYRDRRRRTEEGDSGMHRVASPLDTESEFAQTERLTTAREALFALDDEKREVFVLAQIEEMTAPEIADITGLPINTVYSRLRAARAQFSAAIQRLEASRRRHP